MTGYRGDANGDGTGYAIDPPDDTEATPAWSPRLYGEPMPQPHLELRFRAETRGGHTHVALFAGLVTGPDQTLGKVGDLTFRNDEWALLEPRLVGLTTDGHVSTEVR